METLEVMAFKEASVAATQDSKVVSALNVASASVVLGVASQADKVASVA